ncbi:MAG: condensation domain-containing protein [Verrucomicrobium sp.]|nr:condensation domain-containing protein [Verrucomicrobium sp.]
MSEDKRARLKQLLQSGEIRLQPLSFPQRELWETTPVPVSDPASHICSLIYMRGRIPREVCLAVVQAVVDRQEALRLTFLPGREQPLQMVRATGEANLKFRDVPSGLAEEALEELIQGIFAEPFDMMHGPLYRVEMLVRAPDDFVLVFAAHHAIADGWSLGVFVQDLWASCLQIIKGIKTPLPPVPMSYSAWSAAERALWQPADIEQRAAFWRPTLEGAPRLWSSPTRAPGEAHALKRWRTHISAAPAKAIQDLAKRTHTTLFSTLLTAFQTMLSQWTGVDDIVVGTPVANRTNPAMKETMGYVSGVVPMRGQVVADRPFTESVKAMHEKAMDAFANAMPFAELARAVGDAPSPGHNPVFDVRFALQNHPVPDVGLPGISMKLRMRSTGTARFDLACEVTQEDDQLEVVWLYRSSLFSRSEIEKMDAMYQSILAAASATPEKSISALIACPTHP